MNWYIVNLEKVFVKKQTIRSMKNETVRRILIRFLLLTWLFGAFYILFSSFAFKRHLNCFTVYLWLLSRLTISFYDYNMFGMVLKCRCYYNIQLSLLNGQRYCDQIDPEKFSTNERAFTISSYNYCFPYSSSSSYLLF